MSRGQDFQPSDRAALVLRSVGTVPCDLWLALLSHGADIRPGQDEAWLRAADRLVSCGLLYTDGLGCYWRPEDDDEV